MKKTAAAVVVLALIAGGSPALLGLLAQSRITTLATTLGGESFIRLAVTDYQRGWRTSRATIRVAAGEIFEALPVDPFVGDLLDQTVDLTVDVTHGPVFADGGAGLGLADAVIRVDPRNSGLDTMLAALGMEDPGEVRARIRLSSETSLRWTFPPMTVTSPEFTFSSSGIVGQGTFDTAQQRQIGEGRMGRIELTAANATITVEDLAVAADLSRLAPLLWVGSMDLSVGRVHGEERNIGETIAAENLGVSGQSALNESGDRIEGTSRIYADSVSLAEVSVTDVRFDMAARNLDLDALIDYQELAIGFLGVNPQTVDPEALIFEIEPIIYRLLAAEPEVTYGPVSFSLNGGAFNGTVNMLVDNEMLPAEPQFTLLDSGLWPRLISLQAELEVDSDLAQWIAVEAMALQLPPGARDSVDAGERNAIAEALARGTLIGLVSQGMLEETQSGYRFRGSYDNGVIEVNGSILPMGPAAPGHFLTREVVWPGRASAAGVRPRLSIGCAHLTSERRPIKGIGLGGDPGIGQRRLQEGVQIVAVIAGKVEDVRTHPGDFVQAR